MGPSQVVINGRLWAPFSFLRNNGDEFEFDAVEETEIA